MPRGFSGAWPFRKVFPGSSNPPPDRQHEKIPFPHTRKGRAARDEAIVAVTFNGSRLSHAKGSTRHSTRAPCANPSKTPPIRLTPPRNTILKTAVNRCPSKMKSRPSPTKIRAKERKGITAAGRLILGERTSASDRWQAKAVHPPRKTPANEQTSLTNPFMNPFTAKSSKTIQIRTSTEFIPHSLVSPEIKSRGESIRSPPQCIYLFKHGTGRSKHVSRTRGSPGDFSSTTAVFYSVIFRCFFRALLRAAIAFFFFLILGFS